MLKQEQTAGPPGSDGAKGGSPTMESCPALETAKRAMKKIVASCGGINRGWLGGIVFAGVEDKEMNAASLLGGYKGRCVIIVGKESIIAELRAGKAVVLDGFNMFNLIFFKLPEDASRLCTALRILGSDCEGGNVDECRERKVERLAKELGLKVERPQMGSRGRRGLLSRLRSWWWSIYWGSLGM